MSVLDNPRGLLDDFLNEPRSPESIRFVGGKPQLQSQPTSHEQQFPRQPKQSSGSTSLPVGAPLQFGPDGHLVPVNLDDLPPQIRAVIKSYMEDPSGDTLIRTFEGATRTPKAPFAIRHPKGGIVTGNMSVYEVIVEEEGEQT